ncbi:MAG: hypothetical protein ACRD9R_09740 [Pyrinomonadaceae bacterium]
MFALTLLAAVPSLARAQQEQPQPAQPQASPAVAEKKVEKLDPKNPTAEQIAESVVFIYGTRGVMEQIRRNGVERGRVTRTLEDGRTEEVTYEQRFVRGADVSKDKVRRDQKSPTLEYALVANDGKVWGIINNTAFTPRPDTLADFRSHTVRGIDALLRYKENGSTVKFVGKDKQKNIDMWILELTDKDQNSTRYYISSGKGRVLWLEYDEPSPGGGEPKKYRRTFHDYRYAQNTLVPYRSILYVNDRQVEEARVLTVTYGIKMDDSYFQNPQAAANGL